VLLSMCCLNMHFFIQQIVVVASPSVAVKLLPCEHEVMGSSPENSLLQKCREMLCT
jgi:hypothetical protein